MSLFKCTRCGKSELFILNLKEYSEETGSVRTKPAGWFQFAPGDWRCGCILNQKPIANP